MKTKHFILSLLLILSAGSMYAQSGKQKSGSLLWKISGKGLTTSSYLLGTMHLKSGAYLDSIPGAKTALESCQQVIGEFVMNDMMAVQMQMQEAMMMGSDTTYKQLYSEENYQYVNSQLMQRMGAGLDQLGQVKPSGLLLMLVMMTLQTHFPNFNPMDALDSFIQTEAVKTQKTVLGLETADDQIKVLIGSSSLQDQANALLCQLKNIDFTATQLLEQIQAYDRRDLNMLYQFLYNKNNPCPAAQHEIDALNKDRNDAWMQKLPAMMKEKSSFIAVGALHLAGKEGLLNQLEKAGYKVEAVNIN